MGFRRLAFLLSVTVALAFAACGDNKHPVFEDAGTDTGSADPDAAIDAPDADPGCPTGQTRCGTECVDLKTNNDHCGTCNEDCGSGTCQTDGSSTICCPSGQTNCNGTCVDLTTDNDNCAACGTDCNGTNNDTGGTCQTSGTATMCCPAGQTNCNGTCVDTSSDEAQCGGCLGAGGVACTGTNSTCCGGTCTDVNNDEANCSACSTEGGMTCTGTTDTCQPPASGSTATCCAADQVNCDGNCINPVVDNNNCGGCNIMCVGTTSCQAPDTGSTPKCCESNENVCNGTCSDPMTDNNNCGGCAGAGGDVCDAGLGESCSLGLCCGPGKINCGGTCVDPLSDAANCGTCGNNCPLDSPTTPVCGGGVCSATCGPGETSCGGDCINPDTNHDNCGGCAGAGGMTCAANEVCNDGTCASTCSGTETSCNGNCVDTNTDPNYCGDCSTVCAPGDECVGGGCQLDCPAGEELCGTGCENLVNDVDNCGACGNDCNGVANDTGGTCQNGMCCAAGLTRCGNTCVDLTSDTTCGSCTNDCTATGDVCTGGVCCAANENNCGGTCSDPMTDNSNCGMCGVPCTGGDTCDQGICCASGEEAVTSIDGSSTICCAVGSINCGGVCKNPLTDPDNCSGCGQACGSGQVCAGGVCDTECLAPNDDTCGVCTNTSTDPDFCGANICDVCLTGGQCVAGDCGCPAEAPTECTASNTCTNTDTDLSNCGACGIMCGAGETCSSGKCCPFGTTNCNGTCVDINTDEANCGACADAGGEVCSTGAAGTVSDDAICTNGDCACGFGQIECGGSCITPSVDPLNCGSCGNVCGTGTNVGKDFCVSNACSDTCPAPLVGCGNECVNFDSDNDSCGGCGPAFKCADGMGCSDGQCVPKFPLGPDPAKCAGGGPPISVPTGGGQQTCTGNLGATSFTFGLCSRTNIGPLSQTLFTDAFNSLEGPYKPSCVDDTDCGTTGKCVGEVGSKTCAGGGVGVNGTIGPVASNTATTHVGGDFWVFGEIGLVIKNDTTVKQRMFNKGPFQYSKTNRVFGDAFIDGPWSTQGQANLRIDGALTTSASCPPLPSTVLQVQGSCTTAAWDDTRAEPCGTAADLIPVREIVEHFRNPANNDNAAIGLNYDALANTSTTTRIELPCGYYYLNSISGSSELTLVVKGRTALFIGGAANINVNMIFDVEPTASLDMFVGGVVRISQPITLGSPAYPRLTRMYIGNSSVAGTGAPCTSNSECGSGLCSTCTTPTNSPTAPYAACTGQPGICAAGPSLTQSIDMSQGGFFNGLLWAGYGSFSTSNAVEMYGSVFTNYVDASGALKIHYDNAAVQTGDECPPPVGPSVCESCRNCNNQACVNGTCGACTADSQCCPPLRCDAGTCVL